MSPTLEMRIDSEIPFKTGGVGGNCSRGVLVATTQAFRDPKNFPNMLFAIGEPCEVSGAFHRLTGKCFVNSARPFHDTTSSMAVSGKSQTRIKPMSKIPNPAKPTNPIITKKGVSIGAAVDIDCFGASPRTQINSKALGSQDRTQSWREMEAALVQGSTLIVRVHRSTMRQCLHARFGSR